MRHLNNTQANTTTAAAQGSRKKPADSNKTLRAFGPGTFKPPSVNPTRGPQAFGPGSYGAAKQQQQQLAVRGTGSKGSVQAAQQQATGTVQPSDER